MMQFLLNEFFNLVLSFVFRERLLCLHYSLLPFSIFKFLMETNNYFHDIWLIVTFPINTFILLTKLKMIKEYLKSGSTENLNNEYILSRRLNL